MISFGSHVGLSPVRPIPYIHQTIPITSIQPKNPAKAISVPSRLPRLVLRINHTDPNRTSDPTKTVKAPRISGSQPIPATMCRS